jgi:hypothetical protein
MHSSLQQVKMLMSLKEPGVSCTVLKVNDSTLYGSHQCCQESEISGIIL